MSSGKQVGCCFCSKEKLSKDEIGLSKKLIHRQTERMVCLTCMAAYLETTEEYLTERIEDFKRHGCALFR
jgi:hypothetical protein